MAVTITDIISFTETHIMPKLIDNVLNSNVLLYMLMGKKSKRWPGGRMYETEVFWQKNANAAAYTVDGNLAIATGEEFTRSQTDPVQYNVGICLEGLDMAINKGAHQIVNLVAKKMKSAEQSLKDLFGTHLFNTTQANAILGLHSLCAASAGYTYAGLAFADVPEWCSSSGTLGRANGPDSTTNALTKAILDTQYNSVKLDNDHPDLLITTDAIWSGIMTTYLMPNMRYTDTKMADLGFENFKYRKAKAYGDDKCAAGDLWFLNSNHLWFAIFPSMNFKFIPWTYQAATKDRMVAHIRWYGNLICDEPRKLGWMSALTSVT